MCRHSSTDSFKTLPYRLFLAGAAGWIVRMLHTNPRASTRSRVTTHTHVHMLSRTHVVMHTRTGGKGVTKTAQDVEESTKNVSV